MGSRKRESIKKKKILKEIKKFTKIPTKYKYKASDFPIGDCPHCSGSNIKNGYWGRLYEIKNKDYCRRCIAYFENTDVDWQVGLYAQV